MDSSLSPISFNTEAVAILGYPNKLTDPARYQYREAFVLVEAIFEGKPINYCPYIFVDNDAALITSSPSGPYVLVVMTDGLGGADGWQLIANISTVVWRFEAAR